MFCIEPKKKIMADFLVFSVFTLALTSMSLATKNIVLFSESNKLQVEFGKMTTANTLQLNFHEDFINKDPHISTKKEENNEKYLQYFSRSEREECMNFKHVTQSMNDALQLCVEMEKSVWYGGSENTYQHWPLNKLNWTNRPYVSMEAHSQAVLESYFFNSDGFYIHIDDSVPLFVDINGPQPGSMCFTAKVVEPYRKVKNFLSFRVCKFSNPREAHENAIKDFLGMPTSIPDPYVVIYPIWSTWARYKVNVNSSSVYDYAKEIVKYGFPKGTLEIDDNWETCYGSMEFNKTRFENINELVNRLHLYGFKISLWTHPFINLDCYKHEIAKDKGYFVKNTGNNINTTWWNGKASYIDFTNPEAAAWWSNSLRALLAHSGIDTLKFDAGETSWSPQLPDFHDSDLTNYPDNIVNAYLKTISTFDSAIEYRSSRRSQQFGHFLRMMDRESRWDYKLGLPTLITSLIHLNMIGYSFVLPDMIGGNGYNNEPPSKEMYIRWMQANTFMPVIQFSYTPWDFDSQTVDICRRFMNLRSNYTNTIINLMLSAVSKGSPVNPPIWWIDPTDPIAHVIDDEYLLGENILVAPVVVQGATSRAIYLPSGVWRDENNPDSPLITGRKWLNNYQASIEVLPWFTRVNTEPTLPTSSITRLLPTSYILVLGLIAYLF